VLNGTLTIQAQNGAADFTNLSLAATGSYSLTASDSSLTSAYSKSFTVAGTDIWTGWISTDWNNPNNWSDIATPGSATSATINTPATASSPFNIAALTITGGTLHLAPGAGNFIVTSLNLTGNATLDLSNNQLIINYGAAPDPIASIRQYLTTGYNNGAWNGKGISSSSVISGYALGYADGSDHVVTGLSSGQIEVKFTLYGDANLDGLVNGDDFTILTGNLGKSAPAWDKADFNYDGLVTGDDFTLLTDNLGKAANGASIITPTENQNLLATDVVTPITKPNSVVGTQKHKPRI
jgi:hypothetical protein